ncbi:MAG: anti-sigma factor antagonist [Chitinivibrionales bacterium]|nr:anti-sigma factor antagonist [Chitinivibrionales bacterium]
MSVLASIHEKVIRGMVLDDTGRWVHHKDLLEKRKTFAGHVERGHVLLDEKWVNLKNALSENANEHPSNIPENAALAGDVPENPVPETQRSVRATVIAPSQKSAESATETLSSPGGDLLASTQDMAAVFWIVDQAVPICSVRLGGHIDQSSSVQLQKAFDILYDKGYFLLVLDMSKLEYMSSAGWGIIAAENKRREAVGGRLVLCAMNKNVDATYRLLQFDKILNAVGSVSEGIRSIKQKTATNQPVPEVAGGVNAGEKDIRNMPVHERCQRIIAENGPQKIKHIQKMLMSKEYGYCKIGLIKLYFVLRDMNLHSLSRQKRFYRSC